MRYLLNKGVIRSSAEGPALRGFRKAELAELRARQKADS